MDLDQALEMDNLPLLESLYDLYRDHSDQLDPVWRKYFQALDQSSTISEPLSHECRLESLINAYRNGGYLVAHVNPLTTDGTVDVPSLDYRNYGFSAAYLTSPFPTHGLLPMPEAPLEQIIHSLQTIYCGGIGFEFSGIEDHDLRAWLQNKVETQFFQEELSPEQKRLILECLNRSGLLETFLHTKYVGQKRFSLEGAETLIPMLALMLEEGAEHGLEEAVLGMSHRGRLNVLTNILNKSIDAVLSEFSDGYIPEGFEGMGDVKYHKGFIGDYIRKEKGEKIRLTLCPNPSHLESVDSVVEGTAHAKQFLGGDEAERNKIIPILVHGDAALSGQGVVYETLQLSKLAGYTAGGTIHIVINNQIGFTTIPRDMRSTHHCTDIARAFGLPIFHVNAEDPESCVKVTLLALQIRNQFHCDLFIDLYSYRKYGHNEGDEPAYTQPVVYKAIRSKKPIRLLYRDQLIEQGLVAKGEIDQLEAEFKKGMQEAHEIVKKGENGREELMTTPQNEVPIQPIKTGVDYPILLEAAKHYSAPPPGFHLHPKLENLISDHYKMIQEKKPIDWTMGETLAYATLLLEGMPVRLSGQDSARGTFSHRHALWVDQESSKEYFPLAHLKKGQGRFEVINSPLSEMAVLAFEYGYSVACPQGLTIWEAQFGDFSNGAQVIIDQYIASGEQKWGQKSGLVLYLPHGYEGQGPEHSSARIERFLSLCGHDNMHVVYPTTPAQLFHLLRRQMHQALLKPLVIFTPKGLLRLPACVSTIEEITDSTFQEVIDDPFHPKQAKRLIFCSGRIYYDLVEKRTEGVAIVRIEQLYPLHLDRIKELIAAYREVNDYFWVQEEHQNMGGWSYIYPLIQELLPANKTLRYIGREISATPATGMHIRHEQERDDIFKQVFS